MQKGRGSRQGDGAGEIGIGGAENNGFEKEEGLKEEDTRGLDVEGKENEVRKGDGG